MVTVDCHQYIGVTPSPGSQVVDGRDVPAIWG